MLHYQINQTQFSILKAGHAATCAIPVNTTTRDLDLHHTLTSDFVAEFPALSGIFYFLDEAAAKVLVDLRAPSRTYIALFGANGPKIAEPLYQKAAQEVAAMSAPPCVNPADWADDEREKRFKHLVAAHDALTIAFGGQLHPYG